MKRISGSEGDDAKKILRTYYKDVYLKFNRALDLKKDATLLEKSKTLVFSANTLFNFNVMMEANEDVYKKHIQTYYKIYKEILESKKLTNISSNPEDTAFYEYFFENRMNMKNGLLFTQVELLSIMNQSLLKILDALILAGNNNELLNEIKEPIEKEFLEIMNLINESFAISCMQLHVFQQFGLASDLEVGIDHLKTFLDSLDKFYIHFLTNITKDEIVRIPTIIGKIKIFRDHLTETQQEFKQLRLNLKSSPMDDIHEFTYMIINGVYHEKFIQEGKKKVLITLKDKKIEDLLNTIYSDILQFSKLKDPGTVKADKILENSANLYHILFNEEKLSDKQYATLFKILDLWNNEFVRTSNAFGFTFNKKICRIFEEKKKLDNTSLKSTPKKENKKESKTPTTVPTTSSPVAQTPNSTLQPGVSSSPVPPPPVVQITPIDDKGKEEEKGESEETTITVTYKKAKKQNSKNKRKRLRKEFEEKHKKLEELKPLSDDGLDIILEQDEVIVEQGEFIDEEIGGEELEIIDDSNSLERVESEDALAEDIDDIFPEEIEAKLLSEEVTLDKNQQMQKAHEKTILGARAAY